MTTQTSFMFPIGSEKSRPVSKPVTIETKKSNRLPGNAIDWIGHANDIANRIYHFRGFGFVQITDRKNGNPWTDNEKQWGRQILNQMQRDSVRMILTNWLHRGKVVPCKMILDIIES